MTRSYTPADWVRLRVRLLATLASCQAATPGPWQWWNLERADKGWSDNGPNLETVARHTTETYPDDYDLGRHDVEERPAAEVISSWGYDCWGVDVEDADAASMVDARNELGPYTETLLALLDRHSPQSSPQGRLFCATCEDDWKTVPWPCGEFEMLATLLEGMI